MLLAELDVNGALAALWAGIGVGTTCVGIGLKIYFSLRDKIDANHTELVKQLEQLRLCDMKQQTMIDATWDFVSDNAKLAAAKKGLGKVNSPLTITDKARKIYDSTGWTKKLHEFYRSLSTVLTTRELEMEIQTRFRPELIRDICIPFGMEHGECVVIAAEIAKESCKEGTTS